MLNNDFDIRNQMTEKEQDNALRPLRFDDFAGQSKIVSNLRIFVEAARMHLENSPIVKRNLKNLNTI